MLEYTYQNFYEIIEANAKNAPKKTAIFIEDHKISYLKLKQSIDTFSRFLEFSGIQHQDRVAMIVGNSEDFLIALFAITKIGAIAVPLNTFLKKEEFEYILNDCGAKMLVCSSAYAKETQTLLDTTKIQKIVWTDKNDGLDERNYSFAEIDSSLEALERFSKRPVLDNIACIVYTSGTTGKPKGAQLSYRNIFSNAIGGAESFQITDKDRFIVFLPMFHSFTLSIMVLLPMYTCSSIVIVRSVFPFAKVLKQTLLKQVTIFLGVPTLYNALLKAKIPWYFMWFNKVRIFISGSAPLSEQSLNEFNAKFKKAKLLEGYGLSECSPAVCVNRLDRQKPLSVGLPLPSYDVKIVNEERLEVKNGTVGEIMVKGDCVMQGYLNHPDATDETIMNGWLLTGDLGKKDDDGFIYIVDRKKDLIISKGINIYPREIEELIYKFEGVDAVAVIGLKDETKDEEVIAFIQPKDGISLKENELRAYLKTHLANFKLPKQIYFVEELPKNATGKVLKRVLKEKIEAGGFIRKHPN
ncbi:MAG: fatty acid--CoA ligase [Epsilonproteobacteria bacterium]|uniref:fatty acid--CoA ligase n=1 Tax=Sulfurospirillum cavolei TaxID=366522 RepID=UPI0005A69891|nr:fatty acid--CoA ligase [Sulfurospirillum cavolei]NCB53743.1 fatty acid--CoA ligase [Campylobacterota bacterium]